MISRKLIVPSRILVAFVLRSGTKIIPPLPPRVCLRILSRLSYVHNSWCLHSMMENPKMDGIR
jgi:hypothetical protein